MPIKMVSAAILPPDVYDELSAGLAGPVSTADGFMFHTAEQIPEGIRVTEFWASREQFLEFYDAAVRPGLPPGTPEPTITELHGALASAPTAEA